MFVKRTSGFKKLFAKNSDALAIRCALNPVGLFKNLKKEQRQEISFLFFTLFKNNLIVICKSKLALCNILNIPR